jgi:hypothetical protein
MGVLKSITSSMKYAKNVRKYIQNIELIPTLHRIGQKMHSIILTSTILYHYAVVYGLIRHQ